MFYAIRTGINKGVYTKKELFNKKLKETPGASHRVFKGENEKKAALEWANVSEIADAMQQVVETENTKNIKKTKQQEHPIVQLLNRYSKEGYKTATLYLSNGKEMKVTLKKHYYQKSNFDAWSSLFAYSNSSYHRERAVSRIMEYKALGTLNVSNYKTVGNFICFDKCGTPQIEKTNSYYSNGINVTHEFQDISINMDHIVQITPRGNWILENNYLAVKDIEDVIEQYVFNE